MLQIAFGQIGMNPADFWRMSWRDFQLKQQGFFELKNSEYKSEWERARFVAFYTLAPHDVKRRLHSYQDLIRFPWEKSEAVELTEEDYDYWLRKVGRFVDKDGKGYNA